MAFQPMEPFGLWFALGKWTPNEEASKGLKQKPEQENIDDVMVMRGS